MRIAFRMTNENAFLWLRREVGTNRSSWMRTLKVSVKGGKTRDSAFPISGASLGSPWWSGLEHITQSFRLSSLAYASWTYYNGFSWMFFQFPKFCIHLVILSGTSRPQTKMKAINSCPCTPVPGSKTYSLLLGVEIVCSSNWPLLKCRIKLLSQ